MAQKYGCSKNIILQQAKEYNYVNHYRVELTPQQKDYIIASYETKTSIELAKELSVSKSLILKVWGEARKSGKHSYIYHFNENFFHEINTPEKAYYLGLIAADGCVYEEKVLRKQNRLRISLQKEDEKILWRFSEALESTKPLYYTEHTGAGRNTTTATIEIVSNQLVKDLAQWNIVPRKTYGFITPDMPKELYSHYFRGYFDGDGSIFFRNLTLLPSQCDVSISGFQHNLDKMIEVLSEFDIKVKYIKDKRQSKENKFGLSFGCLRFSNIRNKYFFLSFIYQNCQDLFMGRKKEKADQFFNIIENNIGNKQNLYNKIKQECRFQ